MRVFEIPKNLINKDNVKIDFDRSDNRLSIEFSDDIQKEFSRWNRSKVKDIEHDMRAMLDYYVMFQPMNDFYKEYAYRTVFLALNQRY